MNGLVKPNSSLIDLNLKQAPAPGIRWTESIHFYVRPSPDPFGQVSVRSISFRLDGIFSDSILSLTGVRSAGRIQSGSETVTQSDSGVLAPLHLERRRETYRGNNAWSRRRKQWRVLIDLISSNPFTRESPATEHSAPPRNRKESSRWPVLLSASLPPFRPSPPPPPILDPPAASLSKP